MGLTLDLQVSVVYTPTVAVIYGVDQLLKVFPCFILLQPSTCGLVIIYEVIEIHLIVMQKKSKWRLLQLQLLQWKNVIQGIRASEV